MVAASAAGETSELTFASLLGSLAVASELDGCSASVAWGGGSVGLSVSGAAVEVPDVLVSVALDEDEVLVVTGPGCVGTLEVDAVPVVGVEVGADPETGVSTAVVVVVALALLDPFAGVPSPEQPQSNDNTGVHLASQETRGVPLFSMGLWAEAVIGKN